MGVLQKFEGGVEDAFDKAADRVFRGPLQPAQIARRAEKQMRREKLVSAGKQYAPTLYTVLVSPKDDHRLFAFYPTLAAEVETYLLSHGADAGLSFDGRPLVRFIADAKLKSGRFDVVAENVSAQTIEKLRQEEAEYLGVDKIDAAPRARSGSAARQPARKGATGAYPHEGSGPFSADQAGAHAQDEADAASAGETGSAAEQAILPLAVLEAESELRNALRAAHSRSGSPGVGLTRAAALSEQLDSSDSGFFLGSGEPAVGAAYLVDHNNGQTYPLTAKEVSIGRSLDNTIVLNDSNASREHAVLHQNALGKWKLIDLGSTNGTLVNDRLVDQIILRSQDELTIGVTVLEFIEQTGADAG